MPVRVQLSRAKGWRMPENTVKVDRSTRWGNPFRVSGVRTASDAVRLFRTCVTQKATYRRARVLSILRDSDGGEGEFLAMKLAIGDLRRKNLACWCKAGAPCHADVLLELANAPLEQTAEPAPVAVTGSLQARSVEDASGLNPILPKGEG